MPGFVEFAIFANCSWEGRLHSVSTGLEYQRFTCKCRRSVVSWPNVAYRIPTGLKKEPSSSANRALSSCIKLGVPASGSVRNPEATQSGHVALA